MTKSLDTLIKEHESLIYSIASKYSSNYPVEDLFQVGVIGLMNAHKNYNRNSNTKFSTYAYQYIFGEIINFIKKDRVIKTSKNSLQIYKLYEKANEVLSQKLKRSATFQEICAFLELEESVVYNAIKESEFALSYDSKITDEEDTTFIDNYGSDEREQIDRLLDLKEELLTLTEDERRLIELRYYQDYTQTETANILGMSQVQVSRQERHVLSKMRKNIVC